MSQENAIQAKFQEAFQLHQNGKLAEALELYHSIIKNENHVESSCQIADIYMQQNKPSEAIDALKAALESNEDNLMLVNMLAAIFRHIGLIDEAIIYTKKLNDIQPNQLETIFALASLYSMSGEQEASLKLFLEIMDINPNIPEVHYNLGNIYFNQQKLEAASQAFEEAIKHNPKLAPAYANLGVTYNAMEQQDKAYEILKSGFLIAPNDGGINKQLGMMYHHRNELGATRKHYEKAFAINENDDDMLLLMGNLCRDEGLTDDAISFYKKLLAADPNHSAAKENLSMLSRDKIPLWHFPMLADEGRNNAYNKALQKVIQATHQVLDIGTGSGLLAMMAARAGAKQITACEMNTSLAEVAERIVVKNNYSKQIKIVSKKSTAVDIGVDMPEKADVLVSEILDSGLLGEGVFPSIRHAKKELLKENAIIIPKSADVYGVLVQCDEMKKTHPIQDISGFDLSIFNEFQNLSQYAVFHSDQQSYEELSEVFPIHSFDFYNIPEARNSDKPHKKPLTITAKKDGEFQAILFWFQLHLDDEISLSSGPNGEMKHWGQAIFFLPKSKQIKAGDQVDLEMLQSDYLILFDHKTKT